MKLLPLAVIRAAKQNDAEAAQIILQHFEGYIASRCMDDEDLRYLAENAVYAAIFKFQFREPPEGFQS